VKDLGAVQDAKQDLCNTAWELSCCWYLASAQLCPEQGWNTPVSSPGGS